MTKRKSKRIPKYRRHKASGQAVVTLNGRDFYLGKYTDPKSRERYDAMIARWLDGGRKLRIEAGDGLTVTELCVGYWRFAASYYRRPTGEPTSQIGIVKSAIRGLRKLYGSTPAAEFGPLGLKALRRTWIEAGHSRETVNKYTSQVKKILKWGVSEQLVDETVYRALITVSGLGRGRSDVKETDPVKPVPEADIHAIKPFVSRQVWALIRLQLLSGARAGELVMMRATNLDTAGRVWTYNPQGHKTAHHGKQRMIYLGPLAQEIINPFLVGRALDTCLFSPAEAERERYDEARTHRRPGQKPSPKKTSRKIGDKYSVDAYRKAIGRACDAAGVPRWTPHRLRHNAGTDLRRQFGVEMARVILGHSNVATTEIYSEVDQAKAIEVISKIG